MTTFLSLFSYYLIAFSCLMFPCLKGAMELKARTEFSSPIEVRDAARNRAAWRQSRGFMCHLARSEQVKDNWGLTQARLSATVQQHREHWSERR